ncbi:MAG: 3-dehydroquinate synthase [Candidatus Aegiribacteria sp.]|nr:3-dehydroquinate synthase [Candidatus Aegiribacteria sp.]MBD3294789.1 3-dehydroquinate synthase [Candidatus Fermentibacteria bacterium]
MIFNWTESQLRTRVDFYTSEESAECLSLFQGEWGSPFLIIDARVRRLWDEQLQSLILAASGLHVLEAREQLKNTFTLTQILESMAGSGIIRNTPVVVIGGGLVCDIGALAASIYMRGLEFMLVPTTLLSMVDACLGGKTGVNMSGAKNQVGTFAPAREIRIFPDFLGTLPESELKSGLAEVIKTALIGDDTIADDLKAFSTYDPDFGLVKQIVGKCLRVKGDVVSGDLRDRGGRMVLNLGHTVGHALESGSDYRLTHGEAVGLGMMAEAALAVKLGGNRNLPGELRMLLKSFGLPTSLEDDIPGERILELLLKDKKSRGEGRVWALPFDWCDCRLTELSSEEERKILPGILKLLKV